MAMKRVFANNTRALTRSFRSSPFPFAKVVVALYDDPVTGYPPEYARDSIPTLDIFPDGQTMPSPKGIDFTPGELVGCVSGELGLRPYLESLGHTLVVTSDKDGEDSVLQREIVDAEIVISQPFWPAYITKEIIAKSPKLKHAITAGIGSDHVDLEAACEAGMTVSEVTFSNSISVAEHVVMMVLGLVRNYIPSHKWVGEGGWNIADCCQRAYDVEGMTVGTVAAGRIGLAVLRRLKPFDMKLAYTDRKRLPAEVEKELNVTFYETPQEMVKHCDVVTLNCPLHPETEGLLSAEMISTMKRGAYVVNTARAKLVDRDAIVRALESGQLAGYAGDVWFPQPAPRDHPWRTMPHQGMTPHTSGSTLSAQAKYAAGVREILECHFEGRPIPSQYLIVQNGVSAGCFAAPSEKLTQVIKNIQGAVQTPAIRNVRPTMVKYGTRLEEVLERKFPLHVEQRKQMWVSGELEAKQVCEKPAEITREPNFWLRCMSLLRWQAFSY